MWCIIEGFFPYFKVLSIFYKKSVKKEPFPRGMYIERSGNIVFLLLFSVDFSRNKKLPRVIAELFCSLLFKAIDIILLSCPNIFSSNCIVLRAPSITASFLYNHICVSHCIVAIDISVLSCCDLSWIHLAVKHYRAYHKDKFVWRSGPRWLKRSCQSIAIFGNNINCPIVLQRWQI